MEHHPRASNAPSDPVTPSNVSGGYNLASITPTTNFLPLEQSAVCTEDTDFPQTSTSSVIQSILTAPRLAWFDSFVYPGNDGSVLDSMGLVPSPQDQSLDLFPFADPLDQYPPAPPAFGAPLNLSPLSNFPTPPDRPALSFNSLEFWQPPQDGYQNFTTLPMGYNPPCGIHRQSPINVPASSTMIPPSYGSSVIPQSQTGSCDGSMYPTSAGSAMELNMSSPPWNFMGWPSASG